jgi:hypothetical protein
MTNPSDDPPPTAEERYLTAINTSNLRVTAERTGAADVIMACAWSPSHLGSALLRLRTEFDSSERPRKITQDAINRFALTLAGKPEEKAARAEQIARGWHLHEVGILLQKLKSLPSVRHQITLKAIEWEIDDPEITAVAVLIWWLDKTCPECQGRKWRVVLGTPSLSGKVCGRCRGCGEAFFPYRDGSHRILAHIEHCVRESRASIKKRLHLKK